jgi:hypothetical protein
MSHEFLPTYSLVRPKPVPDPEALQRAIAHVGSDFPAVGAWLYAGQVSAS